MSIAIISVLPKSAPSTAASVAGGADNENPEQDFTSLLFGRLNAAQLDAGSILSVVSESTARGFGHRSADDDADADAGADYPLDFLAALAQAPLERRADVALAEGEASAHPLPGAAQEPFTDDHAPAAGRATQDIFETKFTVANEPATNDPVASGLATNDPVASEPAASGSVTNGSAAKFAASPEIAPGKKSASLQEFAGLPTLSTVTAGAQARADEAPPTLPVPTSLYDRGWSDDFAQKVSWIATRHHQSAELTLNPPAMGNIEISLKFDNDKSTAVATFVSGNAEVRETIETALPRLREMLAGVGIELGQAHVSAESFRQATGNGQNRNPGASQSGNDMAILAPDPRADGIIAPAGSRGRGLVDMFV